MFFKLQDNLYLEVWAINKINYKYTKLHYLGWWRGKGEISASARSVQGPQQGRCCRGISASLLESRMGSVGTACSGSGTAASVPHATSQHHCLHQHPHRGSCYPSMALCGHPAGHEVCLAPMRPAAASPILQDFSLLLVTRLCWARMALPPALPQARLICFNITSSSHSFIFPFFTVFTSPSLAFLWAEQPLLLQTPGVRWADLWAWQKPSLQVWISLCLSPATWTLRSSTGDPPQWLQWHGHSSENEKQHFWVNLPQSRSAYDHLLEVLALQLSTLWFYLL